MGKRQKIDDSLAAKQAARDKKIRAAYEWYSWQQGIDVLVTLGFVACVLLGYHRHYLAAITLLCIASCAVWWRWRQPVNRMIEEDDIVEIDESPLEPWSDTSASDAGDSDVG